MFIWEFAANPIMDALIDWSYGQMIGFLGNFFAEMGGMGVELFEMPWVQAIILFFSQLAWALFGVSLVVSGFECGIEYASGRGNIQQTALNTIKGFMAVNLFTVVPVRLYSLSVTLQGTFAAGITGSETTIGEVAQEIVTELGGVESLSELSSGSLLGFDTITSPISVWTTTRPDIPPASAWKNCWQTGMSQRYGSPQTTRIGTKIWSCSKARYQHHVWPLDFDWRCCSHAACGWRYRLFVAAVLSGQYQVQNGRRWSAWDSPVGDPKGDSTNLSTGTIPPG